MQLVGLALRKIGERVEGVRLALPGEPARTGIEDQQHAPIGGEGEAADELRQPALARAAVEHDAALREGGDADAGSGAAPEPCGDLLRVEAEVFERGECRADRQRELRARAETRMRRDRLVDPEPVGVARPELAAMPRR